MNGSSGSQITEFVGLQKYGTENLARIGSIADAVCMVERNKPLEYICSFSPELTSIENSPRVGACTQSPAIPRSSLAGNKQVEVLRDHVE